MPSFLKVRTVLFPDLEPDTAYRIVVSARDMAGKLQTRSGTFRTRAVKVAIDQPDLGLSAGLGCKADCIEKGTLTSDAAAWVLFTGLLLAGYVGTWLAALRRAPATVVTAVLVVGAIVTTVLDGLAGGLDLRAGAVVGLIGIGAAAVWLSGTAGRVAAGTEGQGRLATAPQDARSRA